MKLSPDMLKVLSQLQVGRTTAFGYAEDIKGFSSYLNANTVRALIRRGLLEQNGERPWQTYMVEEETGKQLEGKFVPVYKISEAGREALMDAGEAIQIEMEPYPLDPRLVQKAIDLQSEEKLEQWKEMQRRIE